MKSKKFGQLNQLFKNNLFSEIDKDINSKKFYLLKSISKKATLKKFCKEFNLKEDLEQIFDNIEITNEIIEQFIKKNFHFKSADEIIQIEKELNQMIFFDWGGSFENNLEKNIINNFIKKTSSFKKINYHLNKGIFESVKGYTLNSWYNHWSSILIEQIFNQNKRIIPTIDRIKKIDFFIDGIPFDLKVTYFPEQLMKLEISNQLENKFGYKNELSCFKKIAKQINIAIPDQLDDKHLQICLYNLISESENEIAINFLDQLRKIKLNVYQKFINDPNLLIKWLYENQGEMRFDASNRFFLIVIDREKPFDSWKLKRNTQLLSQRINNKINSFDKKSINKIEFYWEKDGKNYQCYAEILFVLK